MTIIMVVWAATVARLRRIAWRSIIVVVMRLILHLLIVIIWVHLRMEFSHLWMLNRHHSGHLGLILGAHVAEALIQNSV